MHKILNKQKKTIDKLWNVKNNNNKSQVNDLNKGTKRKKFGSSQYRWFGYYL